MVTCALCGRDFDETVLNCHGLCPLAGAKGCGLVCCPYCGYQMVDERRSTAAGLVLRLWPAKQAPRIAAPKRQP
jgi:hypothetical protein